MKARSEKEEARSDEVNGSYEHCLKQERDRERKWRMSRQGAFVSSMLSLDDSSARGTSGENSPAWESDHGRSAAVVSRESKKDILAEAMRILVKHDEKLAKNDEPAERKKNNLRRKRQREKDYVFMKAVLEGKNHEDLGITQRGFNWKLKEIEEKFLSILLPPSPQKGRLKGEGARGSDTRPSETEGKQQGENR
jgi:hypothetical protein